MVRILIVEDEIVIAMDIQQILEKMGYVVVDMALTGEKAIEIIETTYPDLVLMDIKLEGSMDGIETAQKINKRFDIPVIYLTAYSDDQTIERAKITEPFGYILKPLQKNELHSAIDIALYKHKTEKQLRQSEQWLSTILQSISDGVITTDKNGDVTFINPVAESLTGWEKEKTLGVDIESVFQVVDEKTNVSVKNHLDRIIKTDTEGITGDHLLIISKNGKKTPIDCTITPINDLKANILGFIFVFHDVTKYRQAEAILEKSRIELEKAVEERTQELQKINKDLKDEIAERLKVEEELKIKEGDLEIKSSSLEEANTALKVLLRHREDDKRELEEKVVSNVKGLVLPYVEKLRNSRLDPIQASCLNILEAHLKDIISPFLRKMASFNLTPKEIQIASLIKEGKSTKEIAELLNIASSSVDFHRHNIRTKLELNNEKINLQSYLLNLD